MNIRRLRLATPLYLIALLILAACGPEGLRRTPTPEGLISPTVVVPTATPRVVLPEATPTEDATATPEPTPTETPQPTFISTPGAGPTVMVRPGINVAKEQYDEALAKWQSQGIQEYEVVVEHSSLSPWAGTWTLRVAGRGEKVDIVSYTGNSGVPTTPAMAPDTVKFLTVEQQFAVIDHVLTAGIFSELETLVDYVVTFDPALGYPASIEIKTKPNVRVTDLGSSTTVKSLKILRRGTPVVPSPVATAVTPEAGPTP
jgi:hypothetical protein